MKLSGNDELDTSSSLSVQLSLSVRHAEAAGHYFTTWGLHVSENFI